MAGGSVRTFPRRDGPSLIQPAAEAAHRTGEGPRLSFQEPASGVASAWSGCVVTAWASGLDTTGQRDFFPCYGVASTPALPTLGSIPSMLPLYSFASLLRGRSLAFRRAIIHASSLPPLSAIHLAVSCLERPPPPFPVRQPALRPTCVHSTVSPPLSADSPCGSPPSNVHFDTPPTPPGSRLGPKTVSASWLRLTVTVASSSCSAACTARRSDDAGLRYPVRSPLPRPKPVRRRPHRGGVPRSAAPNESRHARADLMQPRDSVASRNRTFWPKPSGAMPESRSPPALDVV